MPRPGAIVGALILLGAVPAGAQLGVPSPVVSQPTAPLTGILDPGSGTIDDGAIDDLLGAVGLTPATPPPTGTGGGSGGTGGGTAPAPGTVTPPAGTPLPGGPALPGGSGPGAGAPAGGAPQGPATGPTHSADSGRLTDAAAPVVTARVLSTLPAAARRGRLRVRVSSSEPGVVVFRALVRAVRAKRGRRVSRLLTETPEAVVTYRAAGTTIVALELAPVARRDLRKARTARVALHLWAADVSRNQMRRQTKRTLRR